MNVFIDELHPLLLNIGLAIHNGDWNWKNVNSPFMRLYYVTEGHADVELPSGTVHLRPDYMYFIPPFTAHSYVCDSHFNHYYLHIYEEQHLGGSIIEDWDIPAEIKAEEIDLELIKRLCAINPHMRLPQSDPTSYDNDSTLKENVTLNKRRAFSNKLESRGIVYQLLSHFIIHAHEKVKSNNKRIETIIAHINNNLAGNIKLDGLADMACLSKDHFIRLFKRETGVTPLQYINLKKIERAQLMLVTDTMSVKNIAFALGFDDYSYFNRLFKKVIGLTPMSYRNLYSMSISGGEETIS